MRTSWPVGGLENGIINGHQRNADIYHAAVLLMCSTGGVEYVIITNWQTEAAILFFCKERTLTELHNDPSEADISPEKYAQSPIGACVSREKTTPQKRTGAGRVPENRCCNEKGRGTIKQMKCKITDPKYHFITLFRVTRLESMSASGIM